MSNYVRMNTPGGIIWVEVEDVPSEGGEYLHAGPAEDAKRSFEQAVIALKENAQRALSLLKTRELGPDEIEMSFGIKAGVEAGSTFFGLAKASGEASYTVTLKWKNNNEESPK